MRTRTRCSSRGAPGDKRPVSLPARTAELKVISTGDLQDLARKLARRELFQIVMSGEPAIVQAAVKSHQLGPTRTPQLNPTPFRHVGARATRETG